MPTGKDKLNPNGLMKAASDIKTLAIQQQKLLTKLSNSKQFAAAFDEAIMNKDKRTLTSLIKKGGISSKFTIDKIDPDRMIIIVIIKGKRKTIIVIVY